MRRSFVLPCNIVCSLSCVRRCCSPSPCFSPAVLERNSCHLSTKKPQCGCPSLTQAYRYRKQRSCCGSRTGSLLKIRLSLLSLGRLGEPKHPPIRRPST